MHGDILAGNSSTSDLFEALGWNKIKVDGTIDVRG